VLSADLVERNIGDGEILRQVRHRLGPNELVELLTREDSGHGHPLVNPYTFGGAIKLVATAHAINRSGVAALCAATQRSSIREYMHTPDG
jgi:hypothetical protein